MTANALTSPSTPSPIASPTAQPTSTLQAAIRGGHDSGEVLRRVNVVLGLYFAPDQDPQVAAGVREEFVRALAPYPTWAVHRAFDDWTRTMQRRPSPGDIVILVGKAMRPITDELARRDRLASQQALTDQTERVSAEAAQGILARAGFTPQRMEAVRAAPMAGTFAEAESRTTEERRPHWSKTVAYDSPEMEALRRARAGNKMIADAVNHQNRGNAA
ncbi:hypothetical protein [Falsirhodobacter halotolerans]|uniref:hypothetical protein n=1 Tax=Falsirhodobacter halotolerans TaxID=1146892 RepID=UPI001FD48943|nr:hypothetical protein [Falsirhodobacter halotolerans]MCJ8139581.1 hypothetical protein [Falsirhodobacter halotolerans]